jgi:NAD(P)-dependent dehydrogenase (short-subunit alcohol dehydrogenase family)
VERLVAALCFEKNLFEERVAVVTGGASGMGRAIAQGIASLAGKVAVADRDFENASKVASEIQSVGGKCIALRVDVSKKREIQEMVQKVVDAFGTIDILVNNAGTIKNKAFFEISEEDWDEVLNVNLKGAFLCSYYAAKIMAARKKGAIVNVTSVEAEKYLPKSCHYAVSKAGLLMLTKAMAVDLAEYSIRVNSVGPGVILTGLTEELLSDRWRKEKYGKMIPLERIGAPEDIVGAAIFLVSDAASYITGANIYVDGGLACK